MLIKWTMSWLHASSSFGNGVYGCVVVLYCSHTAQDEAQDVNERASAPPLAVLPHPRFAISESIFYSFSLCQLISQG